MDMSPTLQPDDILNLGGASGQSAMCMVVTSFRLSQVLQTQKDRGDTIHSRDVQVC